MCVASDRGPVPMPVAMHVFMLFMHMDHSLAISSGHRGGRRARVPRTGRCRRAGVVGGRLGG